MARTFSIMVENAPELKKKEEEKKYNTIHALFVFETLIITFEV